MALADAPSDRVREVGSSVSSTTSPPPDQMNGATCSRVGAT